MVLFWAFRKRTQWAREVYEKEKLDISHDVDPFSDLFRLSKNLFSREKSNQKDKDYVRLIISDLHLGSAHTHERELKNLLHNTEFDELILAGDILEFLKRPKFTDVTARLFDFVCSMLFQYFFFIFILF